MLKNEYVMVEIICNKSNLEKVMSTKHGNNITMCCKGNEASLYYHQ